MAMQKLSYLVFLIMVGLWTDRPRLTLAQENRLTEVYFSLGKTSFSQHETIQARLVNSSGSTVYVVTPSLCAFQPIQKLTDKGWAFISFPSRGVRCAATLGYWPIFAGNSQHFEYLPDDIREMTGHSGRGTYRFAWAVASKDYGDSMPVISNEFRITD
jgi:hypothetical protein